MKRKGRTIAATRTPVEISDRSTASSLLLVLGVGVVFGDGKMKPPPAPSSYFPPDVGEGTLAPVPGA